jgi:hypothetical protein
MTPFVSSANIIREWNVRVCRWVTVQLIHL